MSAMELESRSYQESRRSSDTEGENHPQTTASESDRRSRRRRAREVSSRYMTTPSAAVPPSPAISGDLHLATSPKFPAFPPPPFPLTKKPYQHNHQRRHAPSIPSPPASTDSESDPSPFADENLTETPFSSGNQIKASENQKKRVVRLFNDTGGDHLDPKIQRNPRPGTPMAAYPADRCSVAGKGTARSTAFSQKIPRPMNLGAAKRIVPQGPKSEPNTHLGSNSEDSRSREASPENFSTVSELESCSVSGHGGFCESPPLNNCRVRTVSEFRSSMPEVDLLSSRRPVDGGSVNEDFSSIVSSSFCYRSLSSALSNCQQNRANPAKLISKTSAPLRPYSGSGKVFLPLQPQNLILGLDSRKGRKASNRMEDVHSLRMLHNNYLQWRFVNAKSQASVSAQAITAKKSLYDASEKITELQNSVKTKRIELEKLKRQSSLSTIVKAQMPYLDAWATLEGNHSSSLSGAIKALQDASLRLPLNGNVRADISELNEALDSATNTLEALSPFVVKFIPQAEVMEDVAIDLARVISGEKVLIEECGDLLYMSQKLQVKECSLRSQLMQQNQSNIR